jgi:hypothetical protein
MRPCVSYVLEVVEPVRVEDPEAGGPEEVLPHRVGPVQLLTVLYMPVHSVPES